jgi:hypothetical protein
VLGSEIRETKDYDTGGYSDMMVLSICNKSVLILSVGRLDEGRRYDDSRSGSSEIRKLQLKLWKAEEVESRAKHQEEGKLRGS